MHGTRRTGDGVGVVRGLVARIHLPNLLAGHQVQRDQAGVEGGEVEIASVGRHAPVEGVATAGIAHGTSVGLWVVAPDFRASCCVDGIGNAPSVREVHEAVDNQRRALGAVAVV